MFKNILFITGTTGAGKSTFARRLANRGWLTFHTGDLFRSLGCKLTENDKPNAPESFESLVEFEFNKFIQGVEKHVSKSKTPVVQVAVETMPRSENQVRLITDLMERGWCVSVIVLDADVDIRMGRVKTRAMYQPRDLGTDIDRVHSGEDVVNVNHMVELLSAAGVSVTTVDTGAWDYTCVSDSSVAGIEMMMTAAVNMYNMKRGFDDAFNLPCERMATKAKEEIDEYLDAVYKDKARIHRVEELVDVMAYLMCAFHAEKVDAHELVKLFVQKYDINQFRHNSDHKPHMME